MEIGLLKAKLDTLRGLVYRRYEKQLNEVAIAFGVIGEEPGTMIDVGAHWGTSLAPFLGNGWTVYAFEPDPANRAVLTSNHPRAIVDSRAISETDGETVTLFTSEISTGISTLSPFHATHEPGVEVETVRLDSFISDRRIPVVDFLKTDVEGYDLFALRTFPWATHRPKAIVCEYEDNKTIRLGYTSQDLAVFLHEKGYAVVVSEWHPLVEYGQTHSWHQFLHFPVDIPTASHGNLIAVEPRLLGKLDRMCKSAARSNRARARAQRILRVK